MKWIIGFMAILLAGIVSAEIQSFQETIKITLENNTITLHGETTNFKDTYSITNNSVDKWEEDVSVKFYENVTCRNEFEYTNLISSMTIVSDSMFTVNKTVNDFIANKLPYFDKYADCYANLTSCNEYRNQDYKSQLADCNFDKDEIQSKLTSEIFKGSQMNNSCSQTGQKLNDVEGQRNFIAIIAIPFMGGFFYLFFKYVRKAEKKHESPVDRGDIRGMKGL